MSRMAVSASVNWRSACAARWLTGFAASAATSAATPPRRPKALLTRRDVTVIDGDRLHPRKHRALLPDAGHIGGKRSRPHRIDVLLTLGNPGLCEVNALMPGNELGIIGELPQHDQALPLPFRRPQ